MSAPVLWGPNNTATNLQNAFLNGNGMLLNSNGPRNYITYNNFENGLTTGWSLGTTGTLTNGLPTGSPTFGSGASGNLSISVTTSNPIANTSSLLYASSAATTAGNMLATDVITIDSEYQAKVLTWRFAYQATVNPANGNFSGTSSNSFGVAVYDVTNSAWLGVAGQFNLVQSSGVGICTGTFQTASNTTQLRFVIYNVNASAGAITMMFDDFYLGPQPTAVAPAMSDWQSYTPTYSAGITLTSLAGWWRRVGSDVELLIFAQQTIAANGSGSTVVSFGLPAGIALNTTITSPQNPSQIYGAAEVRVNDTSYSPLQQVLINSTSDGLWISKSGVNAFWVGSDIINLTRIAVRAKLPVAGWSSNTVSSADTDTRVIASRYYTNSAQSIPSGAVTILNFDVQDYDLSGSVTTGSSWKFIAPVSGKYSVKSFMLYASQGWNQGNELSLYVYKNGGLFCSLFTDIVQTTLTSVKQLSGSTEINLNAGDYVDIRSYQNCGAARILNSNGTQAWVAIERLSGPAVVQATESVNAAYSSTNGPTINNTTPIVTYATKLYDSHNAYSGGIYSIPVSGKFLISGQFRTVSVAQTANFAIFMYVYKNGALAGTIAVNRTTVSITTNVESSGCIQVSCNAGDQLTIRFYSDASTTLDTLANYNQFQIVRVGN